jgi:multidrug efflux pump
MVAVFIPILLMGGIVGRLFREFAVTLSTAVAVSMVVSLTTTPMMCAKLLRPEAKQPDGGFDRTGQRIFDRALAAYTLALSWVLRHSRLTLAIALVTLALSLFLFAIIPKGFFPQQDTGRLMGAIQADQDTSFQAMRDRLTDFVRIIKADPSVDHVIGFAGGNAGSTNSARMFIALKPMGRRKLSADQVIAGLHKKTAHLPGATLYLQAVQDLRIGGRSSNALYQYTLQGSDFKELNLWAPRLLKKMRSMPTLTDVNSDQQNNGLQAGLVVDRETASRLGLTQQVIDDTLYDAFGQRQVSTMYTHLNQYHVVMEAAPKYWQDPQPCHQIGARLTTPKSN